MAAPPSPWVAGLRLRCPQCGEGAVFDRYLHIRDVCAVCGAEAWLGPVGPIAAPAPSLVIPVARPRRTRRRALVAAGAVALVVGVAWAAWPEGAADCSPCEKPLEDAYALAGAGGQSL